MKIYIACGLTHVPRILFSAHTAFIHALAAALRGNRIGASVKYALMNSDPQLANRPWTERAHLCYLWDRKMVQDADVVVAEASFPSTGLGIELQIAASDDKPILICYRNYGENRAAEVEYENPDRSRHQLQLGEGFVSLMALGLPSVFRVIEYSDECTGVDEVVGGVQLLQKGG